VQAAVEQPVVENRMRSVAVRALLAALLLVPFATSARTLTVGLGAAITSLDPHYHNYSPNTSMSKHIFDALIRTDAKQRLLPGLAVSWRAVDDTTWEFQLRKGVKWHDGSDFSAEDVVFSLKRAPVVPNSPSSFSTYVPKDLVVEIKNPYLIHVRTAKPAPTLPNDFSAVAIVSRKHGENAFTEDYNSGRAAVGTGPYKFVEYVPGERIVLAANDNYWGGREPWDKLVFKVIVNPAARVAALLSGGVDFIESVPTADAAQLEKDKALKVVSGISNRLIFLHIDTGREKNSPFVADNAGQPMLETNPLRDLRVRRAISLAMSREAIVARVMEGKAVPAGQLLPEFFFGTSKKLKPEKYDPEAGRKLMAEAGYPNGFRLTVHGPNNRYINDDRIAQTVAQFLRRINIDCKVETMPSSVYFTRASKLDFSLMLVGWGADSGETSSPLRAFIHSYNQQLGFGTANRGRYSNPKVDALIQQALATIDDARRAALLAEATEIAIGELAVIPLHYEVSTWGMKQNFSYKARTDQYTLAMDVRPSGN
jgi:peptide/nickel transport system substrate-binding protein